MRVEGIKILAIIVQQVIDEMPYKISIDDGELTVASNWEDKKPQHDELTDVLINIEVADEGPGYWRVLMWPAPYNGESATGFIFNMADQEDTEKAEKTIGDWLTDNLPDDL